MKILLTIAPAFVALLFLAIGVVTVLVIGDTITGLADYVRSL